MPLFGIRREDRNRWERRAPLTPVQVAELVRRCGIGVVVQPSDHRVFSGAEYRAAGATVEPLLDACPVVLGVKEVPPALLRPGRVYACFAHVIKGQPGNMAALRRYLEVGATLIDYERITDDAGRRLIGFGRFAGYAGMIDALWALGRRLAAEGIDTPFAGLSQAFGYADAEAAETVLERLGERIRARGVPADSHPLIVGFTGGGRVSRGAQAMLERLPVEELPAAELALLARARTLSPHTLYKVVFRRPDRKQFGRHLPYLTVLVNGIYWRPGDPRLVTAADLRALFGAHRQPRLRVLADLSCDLGGSIEATVRIGTPGDPVYVFDPASRAAVPGVEGRGPVVLAVGNLPAELPRDASRAFGARLLPLLPGLAAADFSVPFEDLVLPAPLRRAVIAHGGRLTPEYRYLQEPLARHAA